MFKSLFLLLYILSSVYVNAQPSATHSSNVMRTGDKYTLTQIEYSNIGRVGSNVLWNLSESEVVNDSHKVRYAKSRDTANAGLIYKM